MESWLQNIGIITGIIFGIYGAYNSWRANKRLDEETDLVFNTVLSPQDSNLGIQLNIQNKQDNSIFIHEIKPINFKKIIPQNGTDQNEIGFINPTYGQETKTYKIPPEEIRGGKWGQFHFKIPRGLQRVKLKVFYRITTSSGLKECSSSYDYFIPSYITDNSPPQD